MTVTGVGGTFVRADNLHSVDLGDLLIEGFDTALEIGESGLDEVLINDVDYHPH